MIRSIGAYEEFRSGAFAGSLAADDIRLMVEHGPPAIARSKSGTLELWESPSGLHFRARVADTQANRDLMALVKRGDVTGVSVAFRPDEGGLEVSRSGGKVIRTVTKASLREISVVTFPAYEDTQVSARAVEEFQEQERKTEALKLRHRAHNAFMGGK